MPNDKTVSQRVPAEFRGGISDKEVGNRRWGLKFDFPDTGTSRLLINGNEYAPDVDRFVHLGTAEEWRIESGTGTKNAAGHPFHVHVNPFLHYVYRDILSLNFNNLPNDFKGIPTGETELTKLGLKVNDTLTISGRLWAGNSFPSFDIKVEKETNLKAVATQIKDKLKDNYEVMIDKKDVANTARLMVIRALPGRTIEDLIVNIAVNAADAKLPLSLSFTRDRELEDRIWRDTLLAPAGRTEIVRMRFRDWDGDTVLHCHIVDHEDQGMMKNIRILKPGEPIPSNGAKVNAHGGGGAGRVPATAPAFALSDAEGRKHGLDQFAGQRVILVFFRGSGCLECVKQLQAFYRIHEDLAAKGVKLVAVASTTRDDLRAAELAQPKSRKLPFLLLADPEHAVFKQYGCFGEKDKVPLHGTFVLDARGNIRWHDVGAEPYMDVTRVLGEAVRVETAIVTATPPR